MAGDGGPAEATSDDQHVDVSQASHVTGALSPACGRAAVIFWNVAVV
jgi:hypothetical protein